MFSPRSFQNSRVLIPVIILILVGLILTGYGALERKLPLSAPTGANTKAGALMSHGIDVSHIGQQAGRLAVQILKGTKPADIPVQTAESFLVINLKTAETIGLSISDDLLGQTDTIVC